MRKVGRFSLWLPLCLGALEGRALAASSLPGADFTLARTPAAARCASEEAIAAQLQRRLTARAKPAEKLSVQVELDAQGTAFTAKIAVLGRRHGERTLRAEGPSCEPLRDALVVSLQLLLDDDAELDTAPSAPPALPKKTAAALWLNVGGAVTHGVPLAWSSAWNAELSLRLAAWDVALGGLWAPERRLAYAPGAIAIQSWGGRARACYALAARDVRFGGCAVGMLSRLHGQGRGFVDDVSAHRPWLLVGLGPELRWAMAPALSLGLSAQFLVSPFDESFSVEQRPGPAYRTDRVSGWLGLDLGIRVW